MAGGTLNQPYIFMGTVYTGVILGMIYSVMRLIERPLIRKFRWACIVTDTLFLAASLIISAKALLYLNELELRLYVFMGIAAGFAAVYALNVKIAVYMHKIIDKKGKKGCN